MSATANTASAVSDNVCIASAIPRDSAASVRNIPPVSTPFSPFFNDGLPAITSS